jgi:hypothetical protein
MSLGRKPRRQKKFSSSRILGISSTNFSLPVLTLFHCWTLNFGRFARVLVATPPTPRRLLRVISESASVDRRFRLPMQCVGDARLVFPQGEFGLKTTLQNVYFFVTDTPRNER